MAYTPPPTNLGLSGPATQGSYGPETGAYYWMEPQPGNPGQFNYFKGLPSGEVISQGKDDYYHEGGIDMGPIYLGDPTAPTKNTTGGTTGPSAADIDAYNARVEQNYQLAVSKAGRDREAQMQGFTDNLTDLGTQEKGLGVSRDSGIQGNQAYFSAVSPDAYQSQIQNYNTKVLDAYNEGMGTVARNKERVGQAKGRYEADYNDYLTGLALNKAGDLQSYGTGGNYSGFTASDQAQTGALDSVKVNPLTQSAGMSYAPVANTIMNQYGVAYPNQKVTDDPWAFVNPN